MFEPWLPLFAFIGGIGGPTSGIVIALISNHRNKQTTDATVNVSEKEAHTREVAMIIDGFTESLAAVREELRRSKEKNESLEAKQDATAAEFERKHEELVDRVARGETREVEMRRHIVVLEDLIPNPPGPPARPNWHH